MGEARTGGSVGFDSLVALFVCLLVGWLVGWLVYLLNVSRPFVQHLPSPSHANASASVAARFLSGNDQVLPELYFEWSMTKPISNVVTGHLVEPRTQRVDVWLQGASALKPTDNLVFGGPKAGGRLPLTQSVPSEFLWGMAGRTVQDPTPGNDMLRHGAAVLSSSHRAGLDGASGLGRASVARKWNFTPFQGVPFLLEVWGWFVFATCCSGESIMYQIVQGVSQTELSASPVPWSMRPCRKAAPGGCPFQVALNGN